MNWLRKFMYGRYGIDTMGRTLIVIALILTLFSRVFRIGSALSSLSLIIFAYAYYRIFSKNTSKRYLENQKFLKSVKPIRDLWNRGKQKRRNRKKYKYFTCKNCRQKIRVPRGKGKIKIRCPKCGEKFIKKT